MKYLYEKQNVSSIFEKLTYPNTHELGLGIIMSAGIVDPNSSPPPPPHQVEIMPARRWSLDDGQTPEVGVPASLTVVPSRLKLVPPIL